MTSWFHFSLQIKLLIKLKLENYDKRRNYSIFRKHIKGVVYL